MCAQLLLRSAVSLASKKTLFKWKNLLNAGGSVHFMCAQLLLRSAVTLASKKRCLIGLIVESMLNILILTSEIRNFHGVTETTHFSTTHKETGFLESVMKKTFLMVWRFQDGSFYQTQRHLFSLK